MSAIAESLVRRYDLVKSHLSERQRRVWLGVEARELGRSGVAVVAAAAGVSRDTVRRGRDELDDPQPLEVDRSRTCLLYTSDAADEEDSVDLGGRRLIKTK